MASVNAVPTAAPPGRATPLSTITPAVVSQVPKEVEDGKTLDVKQGFCCGLTEVNGICGIYPRTGEHIFLSIATRNCFNGAVIIFTDASHEGDGYYDDDDIWVQEEEYEFSDYAEKLQAFIEEHKLGTVTRSPQMLNSNSSNMIRVYLWQYDHDAVENYLFENRKDLSYYFNGANPNRSL